MTATVGNEELRRVGSFRLPSRPAMRGGIVARPAGLWYRPRTTLPRRPPAPRFVSPKSPAPTNEMMNRFLVAVTIFFAAVSTHAAPPLLRVTEVLDARTIVAGDRQLRLAGIDVAADDSQATATLRSLILGQWIMVETDPGSGAAFLYRSPDALFVNRELVRRGVVLARPGELLDDPHIQPQFLGISGAEGRQREVRVVTPPVPKPLPEPKLRVNIASRRRH